MKFRFVTYRWGSDLLGGAEIHHRRLALELKQLGHEVMVLTTTAHEFRPFLHWGLLWTKFKSPGVEDDEGIEVRRVNHPGVSKWRATLASRKIQRFEERFENQWNPEPIAREATDRIHLLNGWHLPEVGGNGIQRWSHQTAKVLVNPNDSESHLRIAGFSPKGNRLVVKKGNAVLDTVDLKKGGFELRLELGRSDGNIVELGLGKAWRPFKDFRSLGVLVTSLSLENSSGEFTEADLWNDYRDLGKRRPLEWVNFLIDRATGRSQLSEEIDLLRGGFPSALKEEVEKPFEGITIHCNLPWGNMSLVRRNDIAMPLWHIDDDFFYWHNWLSALQRSRFVLANTPYTARSFFSGLNIHAHFVGPPLWEPNETPIAAEVTAFRDRHLQNDKYLIVTVCRKSPEKRYEAIAASVEELRRSGIPVRFIGVGPDVDGKELNFDGASWVGPLRSNELQTAYAASDVFCLMSESESFGMVVPEAWHHGKPVVVNKHCLPTASLVEHGETGMVSLCGPELTNTLKELLEDEELRERLGKKGKSVAESNYSKGKAAERLLKALREEGMFQN